MSQDPNKTQLVPLEQADLRVLARLLAEEVRDQIELERTTTDHRIDASCEQALRRLFDRRWHDAMRRECLEREALAKGISPAEHREQLIEERRKKSGSGELGLHRDRTGRFAIHADNIDVSFMRDAAKGVYGWVLSAGLTIAFVAHYLAGHAK